MLGQVYQINSKINTKKWLLKDMLGNGFENHIFNVLSRNLESYFSKGVTIQHTTVSRDHGKDIIIESPISLKNVLGTNFYIRDKQTLKIYIECKSSDHEKITYNSFAGNISRIKGENVQYYVLVTNTTIVPFSYYQFKEDALREGIEFVLIDQYLLMKYLIKQDSMIGNCESFQEFNKIHIEYQTNSCIIDSKKSYEIYFWIRNYSDDTQSFGMQLNTDRNWNISLERIERLIDPLSSYCLKLIAIKEHFDGLSDLRINVHSNTFETTIKINGMNLSYNFKPNLVGEKNKEIINSLKETITKNRSKNIKFLTGEAGVGKTRIINETQSDLANRNIDFFHIFVEKGKNTIEKLKKELVHADSFTNSENYNSLQDIVENIDTKYRKCVIIIDDFHNASVTFLNDVRTLLSMKQSAGLTFIFVCRDDFSVENIDFFAFLEFCKKNYLQNIMELRPLSDANTIQLIKSIVRGIPQIVLERIHSLSNNLPLFIIQTIEYMLDLKLVYLLNRNTVGIENIESFSSHLYIPQNMEEIYDMRIECLQKQTFGNILMKFFYIASQIGINFSNKFVNIFFENRLDLLELLIQRRYVVDSSNSYSFVHESFFLYICKKLQDNKKSKRDVANWLIKFPCLFDQLEQLKKGRLYLWAQNKTDAEKYFSTALKDINSISNYSSVNINQNYYYYLDDIYNLGKSYEQKKRTVVCKIYIALHYHTPYEAITACDWAQKKLNTNGSFLKDKEFRFYLKEQTAHSYINAGQLKKSEMILLELLSETLLKAENCDSKAVFDMYDKLSNIYVKYNSFSIAKNYCQLSLNLAKEINDNNLQALSYITTAKLYFYSDRTKAKQNILMADSLLSIVSSYRIKCHNDASILIMRLMDDGEGNKESWEQILSDADALLNVCIKNNFANTVIRLHMLISTLYYLLDDNIIATKYIKNGINYSIKFGINTYIWQFYNLEAIISVQQKYNISIQQSLFDTVFNTLRRQNLTYLGNMDLTYGNMLALTNIMYFYSCNKQESLFYKKMSQISFADSVGSCDFDCNKSICKYECHSYLEIYQKEWRRLLKNKDTHNVIFGKKIKNYYLIDRTGYYLIVS